MGIDEVKNYLIATQNNIFRHFNNDRLYKEELGSSSFRNPEFINVKENIEDIFFVCFGNLEWLDEKRSVEYLRPYFNQIESILAGIVASNPNNFAQSRDAYLVTLKKCVGEITSNLMPLIINRTQNRVSALIIEKNNIIDTAKKYLEGAALEGVQNEFKARRVSVFIQLGIWVVLDLPPKFDPNLS